MCRSCGCTAFLKLGPEAVLRRVSAVVEQLGVTAENVQQFEDGERISGLIASKLTGGEDDEVRQIAEWVYGLHHDIYAERSRAYTRAAREVFANLPAQGQPKEIMTTWHQLEQLCRELGNDVISAIPDPALGDAIRAVQHVHDNPEERRDELLRRYRLEGV